MRRAFLLLAFVLIALLAGVRLADPPPAAALREAYFDWLQRIVPRKPEPLPIRVVDIDERSLAELGQWPWPRSRLAEIVDRLADLGAAVIAFDVLFAEPDRMSPARLAQLPEVRNAIRNTGALADIARLDNDAGLAAAMERLPVVVGTAFAEGVSPSGTVPVAGFAEIGGPVLSSLPALGALTPIVPAIRASASGIGGINVAGLSDEGLVRSVPLVWRVGDRVLPGLAVEALRVAFGDDTLLLYGSDAGMDSLVLGGIEVPTASDGSLRIRFRHDDPSLYISAADVLHADQDPSLRDRIEGNVVFVGTSAAGLLDIRTTALGEAVPGVSIHAQIAEQILSGQHLVRSDATSALEVLALVIVGSVVAIRMATAGPLASIVLGASAASLVLALSAYLFLARGVLFDATFPLVGGFIAFSALSMFQYGVVDREKRLIRRSFSRYVAPGVLDDLDKRGQDLGLGGEMREVSVFFADVRNFTSLSETMPATDLVAMLNAVFTDLSAEILRTRGTIDKFIGDEIMAFWNAPLPVQGYQRQACVAALGMREALVRINAQRSEQGLRPIGLAMGIASGIACVGNIGSRDRFNYTAMGDTVNRAARIEDACRALRCDLLVCADTARAASDLAMLPAGTLSFKGVTEAMPVWYVLGSSAFAVTDAFERIRLLHSETVMRLVSGIDAEDEMRRLRAAVAEHAPHALDYVDRMVERAGDFQAVAAADATA